MRARVLSLVAVPLLGIGLHVGGQATTPPPVLEPSSKAERLATTFSAQDIGWKVVILGDLGVPVGEGVTISGRKEKDVPPAEYFLVDTVNGKRIEGVRRIRVRGIANWPDGAWATLKGFECGTISYSSSAGVNSEPNVDGMKPRQAILLYFEITAVIEPPSLSPRI